MTTNRTVKTRLLLRIPHTTIVMMVIREILREREDLMMLLAMTLPHT